ncbi:MAG: hypothetical protein WKF77_17510 [Planctomycetaceae bacterium]
MVLSAWLSQVLQQFSSRRSNPLGRRAKTLPRTRLVQTSQVTESLETRTLLSNVTVGNVNEGSSLTITFPANTYVGSIQILTASSPSADYSDFGSQTISSTSTATTVTIVTNQDNVDEYDENFIVRISGTTGSGSGSGSYSPPTPFSNDYYGVIIDDDAAPVLRIQRLDTSGNLLSDNIVPETGYPSTARFRVIADHPTAKPASMNWSTVNGTATGTTLSSFDVNQYDQDFRLLTGQTLTLNPWTYSSSTEWIFRLASLQCQSIMIAGMKAKRLSASI